MSVSIGDNPKKRGRGRPVTTGKGELIGVRVLPEPLAALDAAIEAEMDAPTRPEMIRRIVTLWLKRKGFLTV